MKVILIRDVSGLGRSGDVKDVSDGHARNLLIPRGLALPATSSALSKIQKEQKDLQDKILRQRAKADELKHRLTKETFILSGKANKNNLFAAIHEKDIAEVINQKYKTEISPSQIKIPLPIKSLGIHEIEIKLTDNIHAKVKIQVKAA